MHWRLLLRKRETMVVSGMGTCVDGLEMRDSHTMSLLDVRLGMLSTSVGPNS